MAIGLLTEKDVLLLGPTFRRLWPVEDAPDFAELLITIDTADRDDAQERKGDAGTVAFRSNVKPGT